MIPLRNVASHESHRLQDQQFVSQTNFHNENMFPSDQLQKLQFQKSASQSYFNHGVMGSFDPLATNGTYRNLTSSSKVSSPWTSSRALIARDYLLR